VHQYDSLNPSRWFLCVRYKKLCQCTEVTKEFKTYSAHPSTRTSSHLQTHLAQSLLAMPCVLQPGGKDGKDGGGGGGSGGGGDNGGSGKGGSGNSSCGSDDGSSGNCGSGNSSCGNGSGCSGDGSSGDSSCGGDDSSSGKGGSGVGSCGSDNGGSGNNSSRSKDSNNGNDGGGNDGGCGDSGGGGRVDGSSGDNKGSDNDRYYGSNCGGGGDSDDNSGWWQIHWRQQQWRGAQTTINYNRQQRHGPLATAMETAAACTATTAQGTPRTAPGVGADKNHLCHCLGGLWVLVVTVVCGVVHAGCVCAAHPCCFVRLTRISATKNRQTTAYWGLPERS
jgi:hypothetical protein